MPWSSSVFSRSARMFDEMPSSDLVSSSRKCRRLPNIMSRITNRLHLSPTTSSVRLIGQPERWSVSVIGSPGNEAKASEKTTCNIAPVIPDCNQLHNAISIGYPHVTDAALPSARLVLLEGADCAL